MTAAPTISRSTSGTALLRSVSGTALTGKRPEPGALIIVLARVLGEFNQRFLSWVADKEGLQSAYDARDPGLNVKVRIMWIAKATEFQGQRDNWNTHRQIFDENESFPDHPEGLGPVLPPTFVHDRSTDETIAEGVERFNDPLPVTLPTRMEVFDDELVVVDPLSGRPCPTANPTRPGCRSFYPPAHAFLDAVNEFKDEFGFDPTFVSIVASETLVNIYNDAELPTQLLHSLAAMGLQESGTMGIAAHHSGPTGLAVPDHLYRRDALISAVRQLEDRGIDVELTEYGAYPEFSFTQDLSRPDRLYREAADRLGYVDSLFRDGKL